MAGLLVLKADNSRCYEHIGDILTFVALTLGGHDVLFAAPQRMTFACLAVNVDLLAPLDGFDATLGNGVLPEAIHLFAQEKRPQPESAKDVPGLKSLMSRVVAAIFAVFAAKANDWVKHNVSTDYQKWPPVSNFARVVRNALVHGGTINIQSAQAPKVSWCGVSFDHNDYGKQIINAGQLSLGDLVLLMIDLDAELDELGAPHDI